MDQTGWKDLHNECHKVKIPGEVNSQVGLAETQRVHAERFIKQEKHCVLFCLTVQEELESVLVYRLEPDFIKVAVVFTKLEQ